jgi:hypothetical protein
MRPGTAEGRGEPSLHFRIDQATTVMIVHYYDPPVMAFRRWRDLEGRVLQEARVADFGQKSHEYFPTAAGLAAVEAFHAAWLNSHLGQALVEDFAPVEAPISQSIVLTP